MMPSECGTPPDTVHKTPVPTQVMHSSTLRRLTPSSRSDWLMAISSGPHLRPSTMRSGNAGIYSRLCGNYWAPAVTCLLYPPVIKAPGAPATRDHAAIDNPNRRDSGILGRGGGDPSRHGDR